MSNNPMHSRLQSLRQTRTGFVVFFGASWLLGNFLLRAALLIGFKPSQASAIHIVQTFAIGLVMDLFVALILCLPMLGWLLLWPTRWTQSRWHRRAWSAGFLLFWWLNSFLLIAEFYFFEEFKSRFNTVSVDYILYPHEVFINIWDTYPVAWVAIAALAVSIGWLLLCRKLFSGMWHTPVPLKARLLQFGLALAGVILLWPLVGNRLTRFSSERMLNEIAGNGWYSFAQAALTRELDYAPFYRTMALDNAYERVRQMVAQTNASFVESGHSIRRRIAGDAARPKLNVVIFLEESLGSEFFGCLGRQKPTLTPKLDQLANEEGLLFTNIYASGNRTVRGMEGVLSSFPPLPGDSVVVRPNNDQVETIARVLKRDDYATRFLYGGRGVFDNVRSFTTRNGYDQFIEQKDFVNPVFTTIWGVCNEDLYARGLEECRALNQSGQPFLVTMLSVSNHKPYTYPKGRIAENPDDRRRNNAVKYTDYALGRFFEAAKHELFWSNTVFVVVADHGARVYGQQTIPVLSYEIPFLVLGPAAVQQPARIGVLGGQLNVAPTILGLIGRPYESTFFGRDLLRIAPETGFAVLNHNRDVGLYQNERLVVLGLNKTCEYYNGDPKRSGLQSIGRPDVGDQTSEADAIAIFQVADDLYTRRAFNCAKTGNILGTATMAK